jgi:hypothetical protein
MIEIGGKPILWHIMKGYSAHGVNDFVICCGYKGYIIKEYFANYFLHMGTWMREYLAYSTQRVQHILPINDLRALHLAQHETLAASRVRFSEFQVHLGKTMRAVAIEKEVEVERFGSVLAYMEKLGVLESTERWKTIRKLRNTVNHEYEEDADRLTQFLRK